MNINNLSDEELVTLVRTKDQELYREIVKRYQDKLLRYATRIIQDEDSAEDVVQITFIKVFKNLNGFNIAKKFSSWIYRIAHNEAINFIKKNKRQISLDNNGYVKNIIKDDTNIEKEYEEKEIKNMIRKTINQLPITYRSALILYYFEDKSYEEISDVLRIPVGTVGTRISRGKKIIAKIYQGGHKNG